MTQSCPKMAWTIPTDTPAAFRSDARVPQRVERQPLGQAQQVSDHLIGELIEATLGLSEQPPLGLRVSQGGPLGFPAVALCDD